MNINKCLALVFFVLIAGESTVLNAAVWSDDQLMNEHIVENIPVYDASHLSSVTTINGENVLYDPDAFSNTSDLGYVSVQLENPVILGPKPGSSLTKTFIGYSGKNSFLQIYFKPASFSQFFSDGEPFGDPIPLVPGDYITEVKDKNLGKYRVTVRISLSTLNIKVANSGWTMLTTRYEDAPIYLVEVTKVEKI